MGETFKVNLTAELRTCWSCAKPLVVENGVVAQPYVIVTDDERLYITPHYPSCVVLRDTPTVV